MLTKFITTEKAWILSHLIWVAAVSVALVLGHSYIVEHDARVVADAQIKISETTVASLQAQIVATNAAAAQKVQVITKIVHDVATPPEAIAAVPQLTDVPLNARVIPNNPVQISVDYLPLIDLLGQAKVDKTNLDACTVDLQNETAIVTAKQTEIVALKKKPSFWKRVGGVAKAVGVGIGIGMLLQAHGL